MMKLKFVLYLTALLILASCPLHAQIFTKVTATSNPIVTDPVQTSYAGASWIDFDNDGLLDLFVVRTGLYHNDGNGNFTKMTGTGIGLSTGIGNTWADVDNDGDIDCLLPGGNAGGSKFFLNNGNNTFSKNSNGPFAVDTSLRGWAASFGDYNNDGLTDLFIASPVGFASITDPCKFLINAGGGNFVRVDTTGITDTVDAFTVPTWSDYDNDGDVDLFIGAGRVNGSLSRDYLFDNNHVQGSTTLFTRINSTPLGNDLHDGQVWNWIDFDNDGDLDAFLTNYQGPNTGLGYQNEMYKNDNGTFIKLTVTDVGTIVSDIGTSLSSTWGDFDNDGDLDCVVTNEAIQRNTYYQSNIIQGSTVFTKITNEPFVSITGDHYCATSGDYDNDGDLDLFISGNSDKGLFKNNTSQKDFINIKLIGATSNKSGIGAKVRVKANGIWQMREISSQNSFNGMNMLNAHFGFGTSGPNPLIIDSIRIEWPSGTVDVCTQVISNIFYIANEGGCLTTNLATLKNSNKLIQNLSINPNPVNDKLIFNFSLTQNSKIELTLTDVMGKVVLKKSILHSEVGYNNSSLDIALLSKGFYTMLLSSGNNYSSVNFLKQ